MSKIGQCSLLDLPQRILRHSDYYLRLFRIEPKMSWYLDRIHLLVDSLGDRSELMIHCPFLCCLYISWSFNSQSGPSSALILSLVMHWSHDILASYAVFCITHGSSCLVLTLLHNFFVGHSNSWSIWIFRILLLG